MVRRGNGWGAVPMTNAVPPTTAASSDAGEGPAPASPAIAEARALRAPAAKSGLRFEAYLPPVLAAWLLDRIGHGVFADPSAAVVAILGEYRELEPHADLRQELRRSTVEAT